MGPLSRSLSLSVSVSLTFSVFLSLSFSLDLIRSDPTLILQVQVLETF